MKRLLGLDALSFAAGPWGLLLDGSRFPSPGPGTRSVPSLFDNESDDRGQPICPICCQPIRPGEAVARWRTFLVHIVCLRAARRRDEPDTWGGARRT